MGREDVCVRLFLGSQRVSHSQTILKYLGMRVLRSSWLCFQKRYRRHSDLRDRLGNVLASFIAHIYIFPLSLVSTPPSRFRLTNVPYP